MGVLEVDIFVVFGGDRVTHIGREGREPEPSAGVESPVYFADSLSALAEDGFLDDLVAVLVAFKVSPHKGDFISGELVVHAPDVRDHVHVDRYGAPDNGLWTNAADDVISRRIVRDGGG